MLGFSGSPRMHVAVEPCDMRMGFNELPGAVAASFSLTVPGSALRGQE